MNASIISGRLLPHQVANGPENMALDEVLLDSVGNNSSEAVFRTYGWSVPTLSLGYFQSFALSQTEPRWRDVSLVRRPTGGGALWHHHELTYAVIVPQSHPLSRRSGDLYQAVHAAIAGVLESNGVVARRRGETQPDAVSRTKPFLCFADRDAEDIVSGRVKIVGSAQRRRAGAVLQHGSLLLTGSSVTPELLGVADLVPINPDPTFWSVQLQLAIPAALGFYAVEGSISGEEFQRCQHLATDVYRKPAWTRKR